MDDSLDICSGDTKLGREFRGVLSVVTPSDGYSRLGRNSWVMPIFQNHIQAVDGMGSEEQMVWTNAATNIAFVQDEQVARNLSKMECPGEAVSVGEFALTNAESSVASARSRCPKPATIGFVDLSPETIFRGSTCGFVGAFTATETPYRSRWLDAVHSPTLLANTLLSDSRGGH